MRKRPGTPLLWGGAKYDFLENSTSMYGLWEKVCPEEGGGNFGGGGTKRPILGHFW